MRLPALTSAGAGQAPTRDAGATAPPLPSSQVRKKISQSASPHAGFNIGSLLRPLLNTALLAALLACLVQISRQPDNIPPIVVMDTAMTKETLSILTEFASLQKPATWMINQNRVNQFLASSIPKPVEDTSNLHMKLQRAFVILNQGSFDFGMEQKFLGRSFYFLLILKPVTIDNALDCEITGGTLGHLPIHPALAKFILPFFQPTLDELKETIDLLRKANSAAITPLDVTLQWAGNIKTS